MPKVLVCVPTATAIEPECLASIQAQDFVDFSTLVHYQQAAPIGDLKDRKLYSANCTRNRQALRKFALASDAESFLFVDDDTILPPHAIRKLVEQRKPLIYGWYRMVSMPIYVAANWVGSKIVRYRYPQHSLARVDMGGLGCALISRKVLEAVDFEYGTEQQVETEAGPAFAGPCLAFGAATILKGYNSYMDGDVVCGHKDRKTGCIVR